MIGDTGCRVLLQVLGYVYPAYLCYKDLESGGNSQEKAEKVQLWCMYWVIMAGFTAVQPFADTFLFFIPFYYSLKLAFACYLWANNLQGTKMVYHTYVQPFLERHEPLVDGKLAQVKALVSDVVSSNVTRVVQYVQMTLINALRQNMDDGRLKAQSMGHAAPAAGYSKSDSFKSAHSSGSGFFQKTFSLSEKDE